MATITRARITSAGARPIIGGGGGGGGVRVGVVSLERVSPASHGAGESGAVNSLSERAIGNRGIVVVIGVRVRVVTHEIEELSQYGKCQR